MRDRRERPGQGQRQRDRGRETKQSCRGAESRRHSRNAKLEATAAGRGPSRGQAAGKMQGRGKATRCWHSGARSKVCRLHSALVPPLVLGSARPSFRNILGLRGLPSGF